MLEETAQEMAPDMPTDGQVDSTPQDQEGQAEDTQAAEVGQAAGADTEVNTQTTDDTFTSIDPSTLPEELKPLYNSMLKDYRDKTAGVADIRRKEAEIDAILNDPQIQSLLNQDTPVQPPQAEVPLSGEQLLLDILDNPQKLQEMIQAEASKMMAPLQQDFTSRQMGELVQKLGTEYPDLGNYEQAIADRVSKYGLSGSNSNEAYQSLVDMYKIVSFDSVKQKGINQGVATVTKRNGMAQPQATAAATEPVNQKAKSIWEAFEQAKNSLR